MQRTQVEQLALTSTPVPPDYSIRVSDLNWDGLELFAKNEHKRTVISFPERKDFQSLISPDLNWFVNLPFDDKGRRVQLRSVEDSNVNIEWQFEESVKGISFGRWSPDGSSIVIEAQIENRTKADAFTFRRLIALHLDSKNGQFLSYSYDLPLPGIYGRDRVIWSPDSSHLAVMLQGHLLVFDKELHLEKETSLPWEEDPRLVFWTEDGLFYTVSKNNIGTKKRYYEIRLYDETSENGVYQTVISSDHQLELLGTKNDQAFVVGISTISFPLGEFDIWLVDITSHEKKPISRLTGQFLAMGYADQAPDAPYLTFTTEEMINKKYHESIWVFDWDSRQLKEIQLSIEEWVEIIGWRLKLDGIGLIIGDNSNYDLLVIKP